MQKPQDGTTAGTQLGREGLAHVDERAEGYCHNERERIEHKNRPQILALRARLAQLNIEEKEVQERIAAIAETKEGTRRHSARYYWVLTAILCISSYIFTVLALGPYRYGWKAWVYSLGAVAAAMFFMEWILDLWASRKLIRVIATTACIAALSGLMFLAAIRGDLMSAQVTADSQVVSYDDGQPASSPGPRDFDPLGARHRGRSGLRYVRSSPPVAEPPRRPRCAEEAPS